MVERIMLRFVGAATLEAISKNTVDPDLYTDVANADRVTIGEQDGAPATIETHHSTLWHDVVFCTIVWR